MIGTKLAHYEITNHIGSGGMGDVYQATDTKLGRSVAIKFLPEAFSHDAERVARFQREARVLASLNHSNIAAIHGLEEIDHRHFLVMELVPGETLADRIRCGAIPIEEALPIAKQIAEALEEAHEKGIIHRDLKPANIKVTPDGKVKVLDFGLAKAYEGGQANVALSNSPTISVAATNAGVILGTAAYMSPEQAKGKTVDRRADIWAFGVVVNEMLTGRMLFVGETASETMAAVIMKEPDWNALPEKTPARLRELLRRCLIKEPRSRLRDIGDARIAIEEALGGSEVDGSAAPVASRRRERLVWISLVAGLAALAAALSLWMIVPPKSALLAPTYIPLGMPPGVVLIHDPNNPSVAISPDGRQLVYAGSSQGERLYLLNLDRPDSATPIAGTEGALQPFFSSSGKWLAFIANNKLQKVALNGGAPITLTDATLGGGVWSADDETIYFVPSVDKGIWKISARGGMPVEITQPDRDGFDNAHLWPTILPGGNRLLYTSAYGRNRIMVVDLATGKRTVIVENGFFARYVPTGHIVFAQGHSLLAAPFDANSLKVGTPVKILDNVVTGHEQHAQYAISPNGTLIYLLGLSDFQRSLIRIDRNGTRRQLAEGLRPYDHLALSPEGRRLAVSLYDGQQDVFVYDLSRNDFDRITIDAHNDWGPVWTPDGQNIVFNSVRKGQIDLYMIPADKSRAEEPLYINSEYPKWASSWSPDGQLLAVQEEHLGSGFDVWIYSRRDKKATPFPNSAFNESNGKFSPDGKWLAYQSDELGKSEVYVAPYPGPGQTCKVSVSGGTNPHWSADGKELFYSRASTAMVVNASALSSCGAKPQALFAGLEPELWDVSPKGDFFVTLEQREPPQLHVVLNWFTELQQRVPVK